MGRHFDSLTLHEKMQSMKWFWASVWVSENESKSLRDQTLIIIIVLHMIRSRSRFLPRTDCRLRLYYFALCLTKLSILLQYLRVFPQRNFRIACYTLMAVIFAYSAGTGFSAMFACTPIARFWNPSIEGTCLNKMAVWYVKCILAIGMPTNRR
jgi:hypothetical protein